jgi:N-acetylglucosamine repressor
MRKINTRKFRIATRRTYREINSSIVLNLIREHQPISRAELARRMNVKRGALTEIVRELLELDEVFESGTATSARGRRPTLLRVQTSARVAHAVDVRSTQTTVALADFSGAVLRRDVFATPAKPEELAREIGKRVNLMLAEGALPVGAKYYGVGVVVPGMVDRRGGRVLYAPRLGWRDVELRELLKQHVEAPIFVESAPTACALARLWTMSGDANVNNFAYVSVSDGIGVGVVLSGEVLRGEAHTAGEFGHVSLDPFGPLCACGRKGCWEAFACNAATSLRYVALATGNAGAPAANGQRRGPLPSVEEIVRRAKRGEKAAQTALAETGHEIGRGLAVVVSALNPKRIYLGGEVTAAWDLLEPPMRKALTEGTITTAARETPIFATGATSEYRLLGAIALVAAPNYAAPKIG